MINEKNKKHGSFIGTIKEFIEIGLIPDYRTIGV